MQYVSPFHSFPQSILPQNLHSPKQIKTVQKLLFAEIELSESQSIFIGEREMTKYDILTLLDSLKEDNMLEIHLAIYAEKNLLDFLEKGIFPTTFSFLQNPQLNSEAALEFISPYYKEVAYHALKNALILKKVSIFQSFFAHQHLLNHSDTFYIYKKLRTQLNEIGEKLKLLIEKVIKTAEGGRFHINPYKMMSILRALKIKEMRLILNTLPDELVFTRNETAKLYNNLAVYLLRNDFYNAAQYVIWEVKGIVCLESTRKKLISNLSETERLIKEERDKKWKNILLTYIIITSEVIVVLFSCYMTN